MKNISTIKLVGILVVLLIIYAATEFFSSTGRSRQFREELVSIDVDEITKVEITNGGSIVSTSKSEEGWTVSTDGGVEYKAEEDRVKSSLSSLQTIKPSRVASRNPEKWQEFEVDSSGTRVEVYEGNDKVLDIILGRFGMQGQQQFFSYVRLWEDNNVYVADNFMGFSVPTDESSYRNQQFIEFNQDSVNTVKFLYPADSSFILSKSIDGTWTSEGFMPDSSKTAQYFAGISKLNSSKFENEVNISGLSPTFQVIIELLGEESIELGAIALTDSTYLMITSQNGEAKFEDESLFEKVFRNKSSFYPEMFNDE